MIRQVFSIRGATTADNTVASIRERSVELMRAIIERNGLERDGLTVVHYIIGTTADLTAFYPARAVRESGIVDAPVFSCLEPPIDGSLKSCIRMLVEVENATDADINPKHVYLHKASDLRKDLCDE